MAHGLPLGALPKLHALRLIRAVLAGVTFALEAALAAKEPDVVLVGAAAPTRVRDDAVVLEVLDAAASSTLPSVAGDYRYLDRLGDAAATPLEALFSSSHELQEALDRFFLLLALLLGPPLLVGPPLLLCQLPLLCPQLLLGPPPLLGSEPLALAEEIELSNARQYHVPDFPPYAAERAFPPFVAHPDAALVLCLGQLAM
jgi:hypothetical protein